MTPPLVLCDPPREPFWPLAATRPVAELLAGACSFRARWAARAGPVQSVWCDPVVHGCAFRGHSDPPPLNAWPDGTLGYRIAIASWLPPAGFAFGERPAEHRSQGVPVAWRLDAAQARRLAGEGMDSPEAVIARLAALALPTLEADGRLLDSLWSVVAANPDLIAADAADFAGGETVLGIDPVVILGDLPRVGPGVSIGPFAVLDSQPGPIILDQGARILPLTVLEGPLYVGPGSVVLGGTVGGGTSIGPACKVRGEIEASIFQGFANKAHDGFIGHSVFGEWVNLGAGTITSDLKNTYGTVRVQGPTGRTDTGVLKLGAFLGDHVKTGIGSLLATGARFGAGTHFFGGQGVSPAWLPDFTWHDGREPRAVRFDAFMAGAERAMARRGEAPLAGERAMLAALHAASGR